MDRRNVCKLIGVAGLACSVLARESLAATSPQVAITLDDFNPFGADDATAERRSETILAALRAHSNLKAAAFVAGKFVDSALGRRLLRRWSDEGHIIGNHTYSHRSYPDSEFEAYCADVLRCHELIRELPRFRPLFRFPFLQEGRTAEQRDRMRAFLAAQGYRNGAVTIDASDWYIDERLRNRLAARADADTLAYRDYYLDHIVGRARYYDGLARRAVHRSVKHTLLLHFNVLNERYLGDLLVRFEREGWRLVDAAVAFDDPVFARQPAHLPAGESLVRALAADARVRASLRHPAEDSIYEEPAMTRRGL